MAKPPNRRTAAAVADASAVNAAPVLAGPRPPIQSPPAMAAGGTAAAFRQRLAGGENGDDRHARQNRGAETSA